MVGWLATPQKPQKPEQINNQPEGETLSIYLSPRCNLFAPHTHTQRGSAKRGGYWHAPLFPGLRLAHHQRSWARVPVISHVEPHGSLSSHRLPLVAWIFYNQPLVCGNWKWLKLLTAKFNCFI